MSDPRCKCSMSISMTGDGCRYCQPQEHIDRMSDWLDEEREEFNHILAENEALRARVAELEQWQAAAFDAHPNIDIDIDRALDRQSVEGGECSRCNGSGVIPAADKRIGTWGCKDCGGTGSA